MLADTVILGGGGSGALRVRFVRCGDRWGHIVELVVEGGIVPLAESVEGGPEEDWPASPPLADLHIEDRPPGGQVALLVGKAGSSHWSASVELDAAGRQVTFDVACRLRIEPVWLGSTYSLLSARCLVTPFDGAALVELGAGRAVIRPAAADSAAPRTDRWRYGIGIPRELTS